MSVKSSYHWNHDFPKLARESGFIFNTHKPKVFIDWNNIKVIDIDRVIQERDFKTIDEHISEVLDCRLEVDFDVRILDSGFVKLFRLAQLAVEYLLQCRKYLDMAIPALQAEAKNMSEDVDHLKRQLRDKENEIRKLRSKTRRQQKSMEGFRNSDLTNLLKYVSKHDIGDKNISDSFQKCPHCEKAFLNEFYLQSHLARRHSSFPHLSYLHNEIGDRNEDSQSPGHMVGHKFENERLHLEIKELKEKLNNTEKRVHINSGYNGHPDIMEKFDKQTEEHLIVVSKSPIRNVENKVINNDIVREVEKNDKVEMDSMEKETLTVDVFEKWKNEERMKYSSEIEALKKQLEESIESVKNKGNEQEKHAIESEASVERYQQVALALKKQEEEVQSLRQQLQEKTATDLLDVASRLEAQETFWRSKMEVADKESRESIQGLRANLLSHLVQAGEAQLLYKKRIDVLENSVKEQTKSLEDQARKLSLMTEIRKINVPEKEISDSQTQSRLIVGESHESLPPYEEESSRMDHRKPTSHIIEPTVSMSNQRIKTILKSKSINLEDESDTSSESIQIDGKAQPIRNKNGILHRRKDDLGNKIYETAAYISDKKVGKYVPKQPFDESDPPKSTKVKSDNRSMDKKLKKSNPEPKSSKSQTMTSANIHGSKSSLGSVIDYDDEDSSSYSGSSSEDDEIATVAIDSKVKMDSIGRLSRKPSIMEAVKEDLNVIVAKRLEQLGVRPTLKGIAKDVLKKNMAAVRHRRHLIAKEHESFNSIRKNMARIVDEKVNSVGGIKKFSIATKQAGNIKTRQPLTKLGSIFSNVKNKAMSVMRSRDSVKSDNSNEDYASAKLRRERKSAIFDEESYQAIKRVINSGNSSRLDKRTSLKGESRKDENKLSGVTQTKDLNKRRSKNIRNQSDTTSEDSSSHSEDSNDDETIKKNTSPKSDGKQFVVSVISHTPSTSIENILTSPVRKPGQKTDPANLSLSGTGSPMKKLDLSPKITQASSNKLISYNVEPKHGRISKSEENLSSMYAGASSSSEESDVEYRKNGDIKKSASNENVNSNNLVATKGVLKSVLSMGSLSKKKVLFDLDANQMKSPSASSSVSAAVEVQAKSDWENRASQDTDSDSDWNISNIEAEPINHNASIHYSSNETINLSTKQSPKIAQLSDMIGAQLTSRPDKPPVGGIETMFQATSVQNSPKKLNLVNPNGGSTTSIASSILDGINYTVASTSNPSSDNRPQPAARSRTAMQGRNRMVESDLELSDWSIEDHLNVK